MCILGFNSSVLLLTQPFMLNFTLFFYSRRTNLLLMQKVSLHLLLKCLWSFLSPHAACVIVILVMQRWLGRKDGALCCVRYCSVNELGDYTYSSPLFWYFHWIRGSCCCELSAKFLVFRAINVSVLALWATSLTCRGTSQSKEHVIAVLGNLFIDCKLKGIFCFYK